MITVWQTRRNRSRCPHSLKLTVLLTFIFSANLVSAFETTANQTLELVAYQENNDAQSQTVQSTELTIKAANYSSTKPNIILILADDMFWNDPGFAGSEYHETANLDQLARQSTVFKQAYALSPSCTPSRAALLTGHHPARDHLFTVGASNNGPSFLQAYKAPKNYLGLDNNNWTVASMFSKTNYQTAYIGKWHAGSTQLLNQFDTALGYFHGGHVKSHFAPWLANNEQLIGLSGQKGEYLTDALNHKAVEYIASASTDKPFFLMLSHYAPHTPYESKVEDQQSFKNKTPVGQHRNPTYAGMIAAIDRGVGDIVAALEAKHQLSNTVIIFTADNGGDHVVSSASPLRGEKSMLFEGGIRVPMLIYSPEHFGSGENTQVISHLDLVPTMADLAGLTADMLPPTLEGKSLLSQKGSPQKQKPIFWYTPVYAPGHSPQANQFFYRQTPAAAVRLGDWKLHRNFESGQHQLFNLKKDPSESINRYQDPSAEKTVANLNQLLDDFLDSLPASTQLEPNPKFQQGDWLDKLSTQVKLTAQIELALLLDWVFEILTGDKTALWGLIYWLAIMALFLITGMTLLVLKLRQR